ncbi:tripartite tricarboxylate transporter permease [Halobellus captivus]|uniref:tripartite tricarboxylate transporter permease n=1 Tax=Halobellus captivus TaxID=2592614 RepID=UPI0011A4114F|nr:tripartite tricarboxylate transporter permease [Halobellus captivus]
MVTFGSLFQALEVVFSWPTLGWLLIGTIIGIVIGAIPGLGPNLGMAVLLPLTFRLNGIDAIIFLICIYLGSVYGGSVPAILVNTPGTAGAAATTLDGYPMARLGRAKEALVVSATSSAIGGILAGITIILISPLLVAVVLLFGSPEYFLVALFGLSLIAVVSKGSMVKGLTVGAFGLLISTVGYPIATGSPRYTLGIIELYDGISFVAVLIGVFAVGEMIKLSAEEGSIARENFDLGGPIMPGFRIVLSNTRTLLKSSFIGGIVGAIPGSGASISNFVAYVEALRSDEDSESYGEGNPRGVMASEGANNATVFGALIPTLSFGIPGSGSTAILLGGLLMHGIRPGPALFAENLYITHSIFIGLLVASVFILLVGLAFLPRLVYFTKIDTNYLIPIVLTLSIVGAIGLRNNWIDVLTVIVFGIVGFYMREFDFPIIAFVLGVVLGPIAEENLVRSLQISGGSLDIFWSSPLSILLILLTVASILSPAFQQSRGDATD